MIKVFVLITFLLITSLSCLSKRGLQNDTKFSSNELFLIGANCSFQDEKGFDSKVGKAICGDIIFDFDYSKNSYRVPLTDQEEFMRVFHANYYAKFFDIIHIEAKLNRLFRDSVTLVYITDKSTEDNLLFDCLVCNKVAKIKFRERSYIYPYSSQVLNGKDSTYQISVDTTSTLIRKIFISRVDSLPSGLYLRPKGQERTTKKLSMTTKSKVEPTILTEILKSVVLK